MRSVTRSSLRGGKKEDRGGEHRTNGYMEMSPSVRPTQSCSRWSDRGGERGGEIRGQVGGWQWQRGSLRLQQPIIVLHASVSHEPLPHLVSEDMCVPLCEKATEKDIQFET